VGCGPLADPVRVRALEDGARAALHALRVAGALAGVLEPATMSKAVCPRCGRETDPLEMLLMDEDDWRWRCLRCIEDQRVTRQEASER